MDGKANPISMAWHHEGLIDLGGAVVAFLFKTRQRCGMSLCRTDIALLLAEALAVLECFLAYLMVKPWAASAKWSFPRPPSGT